jgi:hypothetical protein
VISELFVAASHAVLSSSSGATRSLAFHLERGSPTALVSTSGSVPRFGSQKPDLLYGINALYGGIAPALIFLRGKKQRKAKEGHTVE